MSPMFQSNILKTSSCQLYSFMILQFISKRLYNLHGKLKISYLKWLDLKPRLHLSFLNLTTNYSNQYTIIMRNDAV